MALTHEDQGKVIQALAYAVHTNLDTAYPANRAVVRMIVVEFAHSLNRKGLLKNEDVEPFVDNTMTHLYMCPVYQ